MILVNKLYVAPSPHIRSKVSTQSIMRDVLIALVPAALASIAIFGVRALFLMFVCVASCVLFELAYRAAMKKTMTVGDLSAAVTGLILAMNLPANLPIWMAIVGSFFAIIVVKQLFGGIGKNFANPAITARVFMLMAFSGPMTSFMTANGGATPLNTLKTGSTEGLSLISLMTGFQPSEAGMILNNGIGGAMGEVCGLALILGGIYLVHKKVITATIPVAFIATVFVLSFLCGRNGLYDIFSGGLMLGAIFMATDYVTSPTTEKGKLIYGIGCGVLTMIIRAFGSYPEGVSFAILLMNIVTPHIDAKCRAKAFG
ncbi:MAG: RnfABCDGE type electron transport complex subunit D, partial [Oscillospiraceae bacterium]|nr:RnfABCDGE type electron transport complex subunit D [Oscillospiraceae bacterium]